MPSRANDHVARPASLARRVALASAFAAAVGSACAALAAGLVTTRLIEAHDDATLFTETAHFAQEVDDAAEESEDDGDLPRSIDEALAYEIADSAPPGARVAAYEGDRLVGGDGTIPRPSPGTCVRGESRRTPVRACAVRHERRIFVLAVDATRERQERTLVGWAVLVGMLVGAVLAGGIGRGVARWALVPLDTLRDRVRTIRADDPKGDRLGPALAHSELEELRASIVDLVDRLGAALAGARGFAAEAAHELRTPLTKLSGELEMLAEDGVEPVTLERLRRQVNGLIALVQRLLVLARPDRLGASSDTVDLGDVAVDVLASLEETRRTRVSAAIDDDVIVRGDSTLLAALLSNALDNALKFSGGTVAVRVGRDEHECTIDVIDEGPGIPPLEREKVFAPFYRTPGSRASRTVGHGVGLALIAHVASAHGGRAEIVDSERGVHLRVRLPRWRSQTREDAESRSSNREASAGRRASRRSC